MPADRVYTREQANALLPWLTERLTELPSVARELRKAQDAVRALGERARGNGHHDIDRERSRTEQEAAVLMRKVRRVLEEITDRGIQVRDVDIGLVDFPGERDGKPVWLCWKVGEKAVDHWHEHDQGFSSRQPF
jgi:hypothetical protein